MIEGSLSRRYAKAFFQLAQEEASEEAIGQELERFLAAYAVSALQTVLNNPTFGLDSRRKILLEVTKALSLSPVSIRFLAILLERDRLVYLPSIVDRYRSLLNLAKGRVEATAVGAAALDPTMIERLRKLLGGISGKEVVLHEQTDPSLIGGMRVSLEGKVYDGTVRTQLEKMKQRIAREY
ncbi:MAG TPA: ATP synthase F1 subunit delta [Candidatus Binatia bacterium]|nr:ATP synthase F1 subunit delta [Candidatus Binatia bacterium]